MAKQLNDITVVTGYKQEEFHTLLDDDVKFVHNPLFFCTNVLSSFACGMNNLYDDFIFIHADTIFDETILDDLLISNEAEIILPVDFKRCVEEDMKVITRDGCVKKIHKSIDLDVAEGEFIGVAKISKVILKSLKDSVVEELKEKANHQEYFEAAIQNLIDKKVEVQTLPTNGRKWIEIDFPEDYETALGMFSR